MEFKSSTCPRYLQAKVSKFTNVFFDIKKYSQSLGLDEIFLRFYIMPSQNAVLLLLVMVGKCFDVI